MNARPTTLKEIAERSETISDFGRYLRDWLHELRRVSSRQCAASMIAEKPLLLHRKFKEGDIADAWLAAYAEHLAIAIKCVPPAWAFLRSRVLAEPAFADAEGSPTLKTLALVRAPLAFKRRNLYATSVDLPLGIRAGRPAKSAEEKRRANADRQRRFRRRRQVEFRKLRKFAVKLGASV